MQKEYREAGRAVLVALWLDIAAFGLVMFITGPRGIGMTSDSVVYFQAAKYAAAGEGFLNFSKRGDLEPLVHYPPLYPAVLALGGYLGVDTFSWARMVNAFLFGLNIFLVALMAFYITGRRRSALMAGWLALIFVQMVEIHSIALSEPLFLSLMLLSLWMVMFYVETYRRGWLISAAVLAGLSMLARYGGLSVVVAGMLAIGICSPQVGWRKLWELFYFAVWALCLPLLWSLRNIGVCGAVNDFHFGFFVQAAGSLGKGLDTLSVFLLPAGIPTAGRWIIFGLFLVALAVLIRDCLYDEVHGAERHPRLRIAWAVLGTFVIVYLAGSVLAALTVLDGAISLDRRILLPLPVAAIALVPTLLRKKYFEGMSRRMVGIRVLVLLLFLGIMFLRTVQLSKRFYHNGFGYNAKTVAETALVKTVRTLADDVPVYSNDPQAFYFYAGRPAVLIPQSPSDLDCFPPLEQVRRDFVSQRGVAVIFGEEVFRPEPLWWRVVHTVPLTSYMRDSGGAIYGFRSPKAAANAAGQPRE